MKIATYALPACLLFALGSAAADSADPKLKALPEAVQKTVAAQSPQGSIVSVEPKTMDGAMRYKIALHDHGQNRNLVIDASGKLLNAKTEVTADALPAPVRKTLDAQSQGARIDKTLQVDKAGKVVYEVDLKVAGHNKELIIEPSGELTRVEEVVPLESVPAAVKTAIDQSASRGKFLKVKSIIVKGKLTAYEAAIEINGIKSEFKLTPEGQPYTGK